MASLDAPKTCQVVLADTIAKNLLTEVKKSLSRYQSRPTLVAFLANDDPHAVKYAEWSMKTCEQKYVTYRSFKPFAHLNHYYTVYLNVFYFQVLRLTANFEERSLY